MLIFSCGKDQGPTTEFSINGLSDIDLPESSSMVVDVTIEQESPVAEQVTLSVSGAPEGLTVNFNRATDKPTFTAKLYIKDDSTEGGVYPITVKARSAKGVEHATTINVTTHDKTCIAKAVGYYRGTSICQDGSGLIFNNMQFHPDPDDPTKLVFLWQDAVIYAIVNCNKNRLTIPLQSTGNYTIMGEGYLDKNYTIINFDYTQHHRNGKEVKCNAHFIKK
ncbi:MAG: hypothetical protein H3C54_12115 [Taibaiella sp.]|nr:hypothetical protein [Taibaiella sp.]